jgi:hypothetical protein
MNLEANSTTEAGPTLQRWGAIASFLMAAALVAATLIYLMGNLRDALGAFSYSVADFLYGPVWFASLLMAVSALQERIGKSATRRMKLALMIAVAAGAAMLAVACIRAANRHYHIIHSDLHLEHNVVVLAVWATLVAGVSAVGWHLLGCVMLLIGSAGWTSRLLPRALCVLYWVAGIAALFVFTLPELEATAAPFFVIASIWQGFVLWRTPVP